MNLCKFDLGRLGGRDMAFKVLVSYQPELFSVVETENHDTPVV